MSHLVNTFYHERIIFSTLRIFVNEINGLLITKQFLIAQESI